MQHTLVALYNDFDDARRAVEALVDAGISRDMISLVANDVTTGYGNRIKTDDVKAGDGAGFGAVVGTLVGLGTALIPGIGPIIAAGPAWAALFAGIGAAAGAATGGITAGLVDLGVPEDDAHAYAEGVRRGGALVTVQHDMSEHDRINTILNRYHPVNIRERATDYRASGYTGYSPNNPAYTSEDIQRERERYRNTQNS